VDGDDVLIVCGIKLQGAKAQVDHHEEARGVMVVEAKIADPTIKRGGIIVPTGFATQVEDPEVPWVVRLEEPLHFAERITITSLDGGGRIPHADQAFVDIHQV